LVVLFGMFASKRLDRWTNWFWIAAVATTVTGFFFPFHGFTPAIGLGLISLPVMAIGIFARYSKQMTGAWRWIYVVGAVMTLYFNVFVLIVQSFQKVPALHALAPTQTEPPFQIAQLVTLVLFVVLAVIAAIKFRPESIRVS
jgi:hypothetical protein